MEGVWEKMVICVDRAFSSFVENKGGDKTKAYEHGSPFSWAFFHFPEVNEKKKKNLHIEMSEKRREENRDLKFEGNNASWTRLPWLIRVHCAMLESLVHAGHVEHYG